LDGANTNKNPYTCHSTQPHPGTLYVNKSLAFKRFGSIPEIRCLNWTIFDGGNSGLEVNVTDLLFSDTVLSIRDSSAAINGCEFAGSKQRVELTVANKSFLSIRIWNSLFWKNSSGLWVALSSTESGIQRSIDLDVKGTTFRDKFVAAGAETGSLINIQSSFSVGCDLTLDNVTFSNNLVSRMGLVYVNAMNSNLNIVLKDVVVTENNHLCPFGDCTEFIIESNNVSAVISKVFFLGLSGRALGITAKKLVAQVDNSSFVGYGVNGDGGALKVSATNLANFSAINSSFIKTDAFGASKGGAVHIQCPNAMVTFRTCVFKENKAGGGGAVHISAIKHLPMNVANMPLKDFPTWNTESLLIIDISDCLFNSVSSYAAGGGAVSIVAPRMLVRLRNSKFLRCGSYGDGGALLVVSLSQLTESVVLYVEQSHFVECKSDHGQLGGGAVFIKSGRMDKITIKNSDFVSNSAFGCGGALIFGIPKSTMNFQNQDFQVGTENSITIESSRFVSNSASIGGAVFIDDWTGQRKITLKNTTFEKNSARGPGGAIASMGLGSGNSRVGFEKSITIESSLFLNNAAVRSPGGAIFLSSSTKQTTIRQTYFKNNNAGAPGGAIYALTVNSIKIEDSCFVQNMASLPYPGIAQGGAISFFVTEQTNIIVKGTSFTNNNSNGRGGAIYLENQAPTLAEINLTMNDTTFFENFAAGPGGGAYFSINVHRVIMSNVTYTNCKSAVNGGAFHLSARNNKTEILVESALFLNNSSPAAPGGAVHIILPWDTLEDPGCMHKDHPTAMRKEEKKFPKWDYNSRLLFKKTRFKYNTALIGGALYLNRGKTTFLNCSFQDNFASAVGGAIYTEGRSTSVSIQDCYFLQSKSGLIRDLKTFSKSSFIHTESEGPLDIKNSTLNAKRNAVLNSIVKIGKGGLVDFGDDNSTQLYCPKGSQMQLVNFSNTMTTGTKDASCTIMVTGLDYSCLPCAGGLYSLQRGQVYGTHLKPGFECLICPFGANCSRNIVAKPNFWGFEESHRPPVLKFTICPPKYCGQDEQSNSLEYNSCQGNRSGVLCGHCKLGYTEALYSTLCRPISKCSDYWFWPVATLYILIMALYLTFKPPFLSWIKCQILWFKEPAPATQELDFNRGYLKIIFYFYQAGNLLLVSSSSKSLLKTYFVDPLVGLFNFQQQLSSLSGFICPFPGFTVVTKRLFSTLHVFGTLVTICVLFYLHFGFQMIRGRDAPFQGPYLGGILEVLLLGYAILGSASFELLRCVPIGSQWRLFYDGNVVCYEWRQYVLIALVVTFIIPFGFVLCWGALKLYREAVSVKTFLLACVLPTPFLIYWIITAVLWDSDGGPSSQRLTASIEKVLYEPFKRPVDGKGGSLNWESILIGRRLVLIILKAVINDPFSRLILMTFFSFLVLLHHLAKQPFRDSKANTAETISLLSLIVLGMVSLFPASFLSLAVSSTGPFADWLNVCSWVELLILGFLPAVFALLVIAFILSQICRLIFHVCRFGSCFCRVCRHFGCWRLGIRDAELLPPVTLQ